MSEPFLDKVQSEILVHGYIKMESKNASEFPLDIMNICLVFYLELFRILRFSDKFISKDGTELRDDNRCAIKSLEFGHNYIMADVEPVFNGIHCWRVQVKNPENEWIMFGIGQKRIYPNCSYYEGMRSMS